MRGSKASAALQNVNFRQGIGKKDSAAAKAQKQCSERDQVEFARFRHGLGGKLN
jgi:hypothetical protein